MKKLILLISILIISSGLNAQKRTNLELVTGGYIYHLYFKPNIAPGNCYKFNKLDRSLTAPMLGLRYIEETKNEYKSLAIFFTENCIGVDQIGLIASLGRKTSLGKLDILYGLSGGFYTENKYDWNDRYMDCVPITVFDCLMPVLGAEINLRYNLSNKYYISLNTITSIIFHASFSVGIKI